MKNLSISFKRMREDDLPLLTMWFQKPHVLQWYARGKPYSFEMIREKYLPRINDTTISSFIIYMNDIPAGYIQLYRLTDHLPEEVSDYNHPLFKAYRPKDLAGIDMFIADEKYLKKGHSSKALTTFVNKHAKGQFRALVVDPLKQNERAILFFERNGFKKLETGNDNCHELMLLNV